MKTLKGLVEFQISLTRNRHPRWKHAIAMYISYKLGSLKIAWNFLKSILVDMEEPKQKEPKDSDNWVELITEGLEKRLGKSVKTTF